MELSLGRVILALWLLGLVLQVVGRAKNFGRVLFIGTTIVGIANWWHEVSKSTAETAAEESSMKKLELFRASFRIAVPPTHTDLERYRVRLIQSGGRCFLESGALRVDPFCLPNPNQEPIAYRLLRMADICLELFKDPIDPKLYEPCRDAALKSPSIASQFYADLSEGLELEYDSGRQLFVLQAVNRESPWEAWKKDKDGTITSLDHLEGSQIFVSFTNFAQNTKGLERFYQTFEVESFFLTGQPSIKIYFTSDDMNPEIDGGEMPFLYGYINKSLDGDGLYVSKALAAP
jgi:hypothetical protein